MIKIILGILLILLAVFIIVKLTVGKRKRRSKFSETEKLVTTVKTKLVKALKDLNAGLRSPDVIQEEIIQLLDRYKEEAVKRFTNSGIMLLEQKNSLNKALENVDENIRDLDSRVIEYKTKYEKETNLAKKQIYLNVGTSLLKSKHCFEKSREKIAASVEKATEARENLLEKCEQMDLKIQVKRAEVLAIISEYINGASNVNVDINLNDIDFLVDEYKLLSEKENYKKEIEQKFTKEQEEEVEVIGDKDLEEEFKNYKREN